MDHGGQDQKPRLASNASEDWWTWRTWTWPAQLASAAYARATCAFHITNYRKE